MPAFIGLQILLSSLSLSHPLSLLAIYVLSLTTMILLLSLSIPFTTAHIKENLLIPHSLTLLEKDDLICVADREHSRILCYSAGLTDSEPGKLVFNVAHPRLGPVYAIDHIGKCTSLHVLFCARHSISLSLALFLSILSYLLSASL